ncbi:MAG TPA: FAD-linked oxidase C-terminal domain-containing protein, partial [Chloroflexota bacterium]|nr:FAD-linked oxidase C-terminal domain-containing protein [Chloroflexota bacterium]
LREALSVDCVFDRVEERLVYEYDYGLDRSPPDLVVTPRSAREAATVVRLAAGHGIPVIARGAGTGIAGGAVPIEGGVVVSFTRMRSICAIDYENRLMRVEPGVVNLDMTRAVEGDGFFFAPDPSSQKASTIGGNVANNAGGPHCLALGTTTNHVVAAELILSDGERVQVGGQAPDPPGYDLLGCAVGSEGTVGLITDITVRILPRSELTRTILAIFSNVEDASAAVSEIIASGIVPAALEIMDRLVLQAVEAAFRAGYPPDAGAVLLLELDGLAETVKEQTPGVEALCRANRASELRSADDPEARAKLWAGRKGAAAAMGRVAPNYYLHDAVVARSRLPELLHTVVEIGRRYDLPIGNVFHAGDGNLHPMIMFDVREPGALDRVMAAGRELLEACVAAGGALSGEHGIGLEKNNFMPWIFTEQDLDMMNRARAAFDPTDIFNPGKILPSPRQCADVPTPSRVPSPSKDPNLWV